MQDIQRTFATGEVSPSVYQRQDVGRMGAALRTCLNFVVQKEGGIRFRNGMKYVAETSGSNSVSLIPFVFNDQQSFVMEFGESYVRWHRNGSALLLTGLAAWDVAVVYNQRDLVLFGGVNYYAMVGSTGLQPDLNPSVWYPMPGSIYEIPSPYAGADVSKLKYEQSADVVTITHPSYPTQSLKRYGTTSWSFTVNVFAPSIAAPDGGSVTGTAGAIQYRYRITALSSATGEESLPGIELARTITGATLANPCVITTSAAHLYVTGDEVKLSSILGTIELNGLTVYVTVLTGTTFSIAINSTAFTAYVSGGQAKRTSLNFLGTASTMTVTWPVVAGAASYNIYKERDGTFGLLTNSTSLPGATTCTFSDAQYTANTSIRPPDLTSQFNAIGDYPSTVAYYQQRLCFGNTNNAPETVWMSQVSNFTNFGIGAAVDASDAVKFTLAGRKVNAIEHLVEVGGRFFALTSAGEWIIAGGDGGAVTPTTINARLNGTDGVGPIRPVTIGSKLLYQQRRGSLIRDAQFEFGGDSIQSRDLTIYSTHLFLNKSLVVMGYQQVPDSILWCVRNDGTIVALTYLPEQDVWGWHRHTTDGYFEGVCCIPENNVDATYFVVRRTINGVTKRYIERLYDRETSTENKDLRYLDCAATYDGRNIIPSGNAALPASPLTTVQMMFSWTVLTNVTLTANAASFVPGDVGNAYELSIGGVTVRGVITAYISATQVTVIPESTPSAAFNGVTTYDWARCVDHFTGLSYLEGKTVSVLADGGTTLGVVVNSGAIVLARTASVVCIGLPYTGTMETLDIEPVQATLEGKKKQVVGVYVGIASSRIFKAGTDTSHLREAKLRTVEPYNSPTDRKTGVLDIRTSGVWGDNGRVVIVQDLPLPLSVLSLSPEYKVGA